MSVMSGTVKQPVPVLETQALSRRFGTLLAVDALGALMLARGTSVYGVGWDMGVLEGATTLLVVIAGQLYPRVAV